MSGREPQPADPTDDGAFRHAFLALFDEEDAHHLQQAGVILSQAVIAGDPQYDPMDRFEAACRDARALQVYLQEVRDLAREDEDPRGAAVVKHAEWWGRQLGDVVAGMEADLRKLPTSKPEPGPPEEFVADLRRLLAEALKIPDDPGCRPVAHLVDGLRNCLGELGEEPDLGEGEGSPPLTDPAGSP